MAQPEAVFQTGRQLRAQEARLRPQVATALAAPVEIARQVRLEENDRLGGERPVLGGAQGHHVNAAFPGGLGRRAAQAHHGVGEARAVHVHRQSVRMRCCSERREFGERIDRAPFGGLGRADGGRLHVMHAHLAGMCDGRGQLRGPDFPVGGVEGQKLRAAGVELRRATLIGIDVGDPVTVDRAVGRGDRRQRQGVRRRAGGDRKYLHGSLEQLPGKRGEARRLSVVPVRMRATPVYPGQGLQDLGSHWRDGVAGEGASGFRHAHPWSI